jgi:hypothetical protein
MSHDQLIVQLQLTTSTLGALNLVGLHYES